MTRSKVMRHGLLGLVMPLALVLASCSGTASIGELGALQARLTNCPTNGQELAALDSEDASGSARGDQLMNTRLPVIRDILTQVAVCGGRARVVAFSSSAAATATIYDGELKPAGATDNARLRRVPSMVDAAMQKVTANYAPAVASLPPGGTDVFSQFELGREYLDQLSGTGVKTKLWLVIQSDGIQTVGAQLANPNLTAIQGAAIGASVPMPRLPGAEVLVTGVGKTAGDPPPTSYVNALKAAYLAACKNTHAASCTVVTDYTGR